MGRCGLAWTARGVAAVSFPEGSDAATAARLRRRVPEAVETEPPPPVRAVMQKIVALMDGEDVDFADAPLDLEGAPDLHRRVWALALTIPRGKTMTYGELARRIGEPGAAQAVGQALGRNPVPIVVPCHRVLAADGRTGGFSAPGGVDSKLKLLQIEGWRSPAGPTLFDDDPVFAELRRR